MGARFALVSILLTSSIIKISGEREPYDYLVFDGSSYRHPLDSLRKGVEENGGYIVEETADYFRKAKEEVVAQTSDRQLKKILNFFVELADSRSDSNVCNSNGIIIFTETILSIFGGVENFARMADSEEEQSINDVKLFRFLKHYGREQLKRCLSPSHMQTRISELCHTIDTNSEFIFDKLISMGEFPVSQLELVDASNRLSFLEGKIKVLEMLKTMKEFAGKSIGRFRQEPSKKLVDFIYATCNKITNPIANVLDSYNLGRALVPSATNKLIMLPRFLKQNEYLRLCRQIQNPSTYHRASENIIKNAQNPVYTCK